MTVPERPRCRGTSIFSELLPAWPLLSAFLLASLVLAVTPGPGVFYVIGQSVLLGVLFVFIALCTDCVYAVLAGFAAPMLRRSSGAARFGSYATGGAFIALGLLTALGGTRAKA